MNMKKLEYQIGKIAGRTLGIGLLIVTFAGGLALIRVATMLLKYAFGL